MANTHIWKGKCTGTKGLLLREGKPFDVNEHKYLDIDAAVADGRAVPLNKEEKEERPYTPPPSADFNVQPVNEKKKGK